jgi:histone H3/H4
LAINISSRPLLQAKYATVQARAEASKQGVVAARPVPQGLKVLKDIRKLQRSSDLLLPKRTFGNLVKALTSLYSSQPEGLRWSVVAIEALQLGAEAFLVETFHQASRCAAHAKRYASLSCFLACYRQRRHSVLYYDLCAVLCLAVLLVLFCMRR